METATEIDDFFDELKSYAEENESGNSVYILNRPLGDKRYSYEYEKAAVILIPGHKMLFIDYGNNPDAFDEYVDEFVDDTGHISDKYDYMQVLGRANKWRKEFVVGMQYEEAKELTLATLLGQIKLPDKESSRKGEFLISLLTGSINDIQKTGIDYPETVLEKIKRKIVLFDGDQTRFIYDEPHQSRITIQGLAGTGKTELLLHKIKEIYTQNKEVRIAFTCHNKILAENLRARIPEFFNFMKVQEQIKWEEKLWVMSSWGSKADRNSGVYSYICNYYNIDFERFSYSTTFDTVCQHALDNLQELEKTGKLESCFDYILVDESQDFAESFFKLCEKVTSKCVYVAGDIFQNVFDSEDISKVVFTFDMERVEEPGDNYRIYDLILNMEIDNRLIVLMERILNQIDFEESTMDEIIEKAYFDVAEEGYSEDEVGKCFNLVMRLLSMELGYIRYDDDLEHENGALHPRYHLDVNYSSKGTYKLGLNSGMREEEFIGLLDIRTICKYIM